MDTIRNMRGEEFILFVTNAGKQLVDSQSGGTVKIVSWDYCQTTLRIYTALSEVFSLFVSQFTYLEPTGSQSGRHSI